MLKLVSEKFESLAYRIELLSECGRLKRAKRILPSNYRYLCMKYPSTYDDFIHLLCFFDNRCAINLIDVGANVGKFSADFLLFFPNAKSILCIEPISSLIKSINTNINDERVTAINVALGRKEDTMSIRYPVNNTTLASFYEYVTDVNSLYNVSDVNIDNVKVKKLDDVASEFSINERFIVKIDTQGHEIEVIAGGLETLSRASAVILECSFVNEYSNNLSSTFVEATKILSELNLYPIIFQRYGKSISSYAFERDVIFVRQELLARIFYKNYCI